MRNMYTGGNRTPRERRNTGGQGKRRGETEEKKDDVPGHFVSHREDVPLRMEMLAHAHLAEADHGHDTDIEREHRAPFVVARHGGDRVRLGHHGVRLESLRLGMSLDLGRPRGCGRKCGCVGLHLRGGGRAWRACRMSPSAAVARVCGRVARVVRLVVRGERGQRRDGRARAVRIRVVPRPATASTAVVIVIVAPHSEERVLSQGSSVFRLRGGVRRRRRTGRRRRRRNYPDTFARRRDQRVGAGRRRRMRRGRAARVRGWSGIGRFGPNPNSGGAGFRPARGPADVTGIFLNALALPGLFLATAAGLEANVTGGKHRIGVGVFGFELVGGAAEVCSKCGLLAGREEGARQGGARGLRDGGIGEDDGNAVAIGGGTRVGALGAVALEPDDGLELDDAVEEYAGGEMKKIVERGEGRGRGRTLFRRSCADCAQRRG